MCERNVTLGCPLKRNYNVWHRRPPHWNNTNVTILRDLLTEYVFFHREHTLNLKAFNLIEVLLYICITPILLPIRPFFYIHRDIDVFLCCNMCHISIIPYCYSQPAADGMTVVKFVCKWDVFVESASIWSLEMVPMYFAIFSEFEKVDYVNLCFSYLSIEQCL